MHRIAGARALLVASLLLSSAPYARAQEAGLDPGELGKNEKIVAANTFNTYRGVGDYTKFFAGTLVSDMATWREGMRILDGGAGHANFLRDVVAGAESKPEAIAVGAARPVEKLGSDAKAPVPDGVTYIEGLLGDAASDFALEKRIGLGTIDRIVEVYGASHYSPALDRVLESYGRLLKPGGKLYLHMDPYTELRDRNGEPLSAASYLRRIRGVKVVHSSLVFDSSAIDRPQLSVVLERTSAPLAVPALELLSLTAGGPPRRVFGSDLPALAAPEDGPMKALERAWEVEPSLRRRAFVSPFTRRARVRNPETRTLVVTSNGEVVTAEGPKDTLKGLFDFRIVGGVLVPGDGEATARLGTFDRIVHDARTGDPGALLETFSRILKPGGTLELRAAEGFEPAPTDGLREKYRSTGNGMTRFEFERGERTGLIDRLEGASDLLRERTRAAVSGERVRER